MLSKEVVDIAVSDAIKNIPKSYKDDASFQKCAVTEIDMCIKKSLKKKVKNGGGIELCNDYLTDNMKDNCRTSFVLKSAMESGNIAECDSLKDKNSKTACALEVSHIIAVQNKSLNACNGLEENISKKCVTKTAKKLAVTLKDLSWCDKMGEDEIDKKICKREIEDLMAEENKRKEEKIDRENKEREEVRKREHQQDINDEGNKKKIDSESE